MVFSESIPILLTTMLTRRLNERQFVSRKLRRAFPWLAISALAGFLSIVTVTAKAAPDAPERRRRLAALLFGPNQKPSDAHELRGADSNESMPEAPHEQNEAPSSEDP